MDASGQFLSGGFQQGKFVSLGEFDQCLDTVSTDNGNNDPLYGKYCLVRPVIPVPEDTHIKKGEQIARLHMPSISRFLNDEYLETYLGLYKFYRATLLQIGVCMPHKCQAENVQSAINQCNLIHLVHHNVKIDFYSFGTQNWPKYSDWTKMFRFER